MRCGATKVGCAGGNATNISYFTDAIIEAEVLTSFDKSTSEKWD